MACGSAAALAEHATVSGKVVQRGCLGSAPSNPSACDTPKAGVTLQFRDLATDSEYVTTTGGGGRYTLNLPAGNYRITLNIHTSVLAGPDHISVLKQQQVTADYLVQAPYR